jgi:hypothetical protein
MKPSFQPPDPKGFWRKSPHDVIEMKLLAMEPQQSFLGVETVLDRWLHPRVNNPEKDKPSASKGFELFDGQISFEDSAATSGTYNADENFASVNYLMNLFLNRIQLNRRPSMRISRSVVMTLFLSLVRADP